jgi:2-C-methyl-D-erythritol 4-phosphate cytidylyltransferase
MWSFESLIHAGCRPCIVVVPPEHVDEARDLVGGVAPVVSGGATRQASVFNGLQHVTSPFVVVHDAARPLASSALVETVVAAAARADGAVAALPVDETLKRVIDGRVDTTLARSGLWATQTPQAFATEILRAAHERAHTRAIDATDDAQLVEELGGTIVIVEGERSNLKLTRPGDFAVAEALLKT